MASVKLAEGEELGSNLLPAGHRSQGYSRETGDEGAQMALAAIQPLGLLAGSAGVQNAADGPLGA